MIVCDGIDEYSDSSGIVTLKDRLIKIRKELDTGISISQLKVIFTTRLEAGLPERFGVGKFVRLLPFTSEQVTEFFQRYGQSELTFKDIENYKLQEEKDSYYYRIDLTKPLFCWMFAISYPGLEVTENMDIGIARLILYSKFIHSILEGRYQYSREIVKEKWIMRKIAALKAIFEEVYEEDLPKHLQKFIDKEPPEINLIGTYDAKF